MLALIAIIAATTPATRGPTPVVRPGTTVQVAPPLSSSYDAGVMIVSCPTATDSTAGCLSASDWNTFNSTVGGDYETWLSTLQDGGAGAFIPVIDYEWTSSASSTSMLQVNNDHLFALLTDGGNAIGSQQIRNYDGGFLIDSKGVYSVRGANGDPSIWYDIRTGDNGWPDVGNGIRYEFCHTPSWNSAHWRNGVNPEWDGTNYAWDLGFTNAHTVFMGFGHLEKENLYVRIGGTPLLTLDIPNIKQMAGQLYCTATELVNIGGGKCYVWVKHDSCAQTPVQECFAQTIVGSDKTGTVGCPGNASYLTLGNRQVCGDVSNCAPSTGHYSAVRVSVKP